MSNGAEAEQWDVVVIGGGGAGMSAATAAARWGAKVLLVERTARTGGDCTWTGCIPSKALIRCARAAADARSNSRFGVTAGDGEPVVDWASVRSHWESSQKTIYLHDDAPEVLRQSGVVVRTQTEVTFVSTQELDLRPINEVDSDGRRAGDGAGVLSTDMATTRVSASRIILAVGAHPVVPTTIKGLDTIDRVATSDTIWEKMDRQPKGMVVLGAGPIGCELAQAMARLGTQVTLVGTILPREAPEAQELVENALVSDGVQIEAGRVRSIRVDSDVNAVTLEVQDGKGAVRSVAGAQADIVLCALGRSAAPALQSLGLEAAGVAIDTDTRGNLVLDKYLRTSVKTIFAVVCHSDCVVR